jgi:hypothetical protein
VGILQIEERLALQTPEVAGAVVDISPQVVEVAAVQVSQLFDIPTHLHWQQQQVHPT